MKKPLLMLAFLGIQALFLNSCEKEDQVYVVNNDNCHFIRSQAKEDFDVVAMLNKIAKEDSQHRRFLICSTPDTAQNISDRISHCEIDLAACQSK